MSLSSDISTVSGALANIRQAIMLKGQTPSGDITTYANAISAIPVSTGGESTKENGISVDNQHNLVIKSDYLNDIFGFTLNNQYRFLSDITLTPVSENWGNGVNYSYSTPNNQTIVSVNATPQNNKLYLYYRGGNDNSIQGIQDSTQLNQNTDFLLAELNYSSVAPSQENNWHSSYQLESVSVIAPSDWT